VSSPATDLLLHNPHSATLTTTTSSKDTQPQHLGPQGQQSCMRLICKSIFSTIDRRRPGILIAHADWL